MARVICVAGESGSGKTTAMRNLNPAETFYIDADKKGLSWKGWKSQYNKANKNYYCSDIPEKIQLVLTDISDKHPEIKTVIIDTIGSIMVADEMRRMKEKGYDKWADLAVCMWNLVDCAYPLRSDLTIIFLAHTQTERDEDGGYMFTRIKTNGKKLNKISLETKFTTVLLSKCVNGEYVFETRANNSVAKTPMGLFDTDTIPNDIVPVIKALEEYEN